MTTSTFPTQNEDDRAAVSIARSRARANTVIQYELNVLAHSVVGVVQSAGGWLFDRRMAGWSVNVLVADRNGERALSILGLRTGDLEGALECMTGGPERAAIVAVAADILAADDRVREEFATALRDGLTEVALWGDACPEPIGRNLHAVQYRLSRAARAFKTHALAAAGASPVSVGSTETLLRGGAMTCLSLGDDLVPVG